jgi:hypothetical protein
MTANLEFLAGLIRRHGFETLLVQEFGWEHHAGRLNVASADSPLTLVAVASKRGVVAFTTSERPSSYRLRREISRQAARSFPEHLIVYAAPEEEEQTWQWVIRAPRLPLIRREITYGPLHTADTLLAQLRSLDADLDSRGHEANVQSASIREHVSMGPAARRLHARYEDAYTGFRQGVRSTVDDRVAPGFPAALWYRMLFLSIVQRQGLLDDDRDYLRHRLDEEKAAGGSQFYAKCVVPILEHLGVPGGEGGQDTRRLANGFPRLTGSLSGSADFLQSYRESELDDDVLEAFLDFCDADLLPDLGGTHSNQDAFLDTIDQVFELHVNGKEGRPYFVSPDVSAYLCGSTILPCVLSRLADSSDRDLLEDHGAWPMLVADPDRYVFPDARKGAGTPLPSEIAVGVDSIESRGQWCAFPPPEHALAGETWRDVLARRQSHAGTRTRLWAGEIRSAPEFVSYNVDIHQFVQDTIEGSDEPKLLNSLWDAISQVKVLDPCCGAGSLLVAALDTLKPLYAACLDRMEAAVSESAACGTDEEYVTAFKPILERAATYPSRSYFVVKSILVNNLFGVDVDPEAIEVAKLRLLLRLVREAHSLEDLQLLPDLDFNMRVGNALLGLASRPEIEQAMRRKGDQMRLLFPQDVAAIEQVETRAADVDRLLQRYRASQTAQEVGTPNSTSDAERDSLLQLMRDFEGELNKYLAQDRGIDTAESDTYADWLSAFRPLHWYVEFYGVLSRGGFDVILMDPPHGRRSRARAPYPRERLGAMARHDLSVCFLEKACRLVGQGRFTAAILRLAAPGSELGRQLQEVSGAHMDCRWAAHFASAPTSLLEGLPLPITILLGRKKAKQADLVSNHSTGLIRHSKQERNCLFSARIRYRARRRSFRGDGDILLRLGRDLEESAFAKIRSHPATIEQSTASSGGHLVFYLSHPGPPLTVLDFAPASIESSTGNRRQRSGLQSLRFKSATSAQVAVAVLNSSLFYWIWTVTSDARRLSRRDLLSFPLSPNALPGPVKDKLASLGVNYMLSLRSTSRLARRGRVSVETFDHTSCKPILDDIDHILAEIYGLSGEETDYVISFDCKYRVPEAHLAHPVP